MWFKPKIFISSTLSLDKIRTNLNDFFLSIGGEPLIYERNLTPSVSKLSYRNDIKESDFVILIIDKTYGSKTEKGKSGTHEEYEISSMLNIPTHIYIKSESDEIEDDLMNFINQIKSDNASYYLYRDDVELITRIKQTAFVIGKEISSHNLNLQRKSPNEILQMGIEQDFETAVLFLKDIKEIQRESLITFIDGTNSSIYMSYLGIWLDTFNSSNWLFIDSSLDNSFRKILTASEKYSKELVGVLTSNHQNGHILLPSGMDIHFSGSKLISESHSTTKMLGHLRELKKRINEFENLIYKLKKRADFTT